MRILLRLFTVPVSSGFSRLISQHIHCDMNDIFTSRVYHGGEGFSSFNHLVCGS